MRTRADDFVEKQARAAEMRMTNVFKILSRFFIGALEPVFLLGYHQRIQALFRVEGGDLRKVVALCVWDEMKHLLFFGMNQFLVRDHILSTWTP